MTQVTGGTGHQEGPKDEAAAKVQDAASVAQEKASELREQGSTRLRSEFDQRSSQAGSQARSLAEALRRSGSDLDSQGNGNAARLTGQAADRIERVGSYLEQTSGDDLMQEIEAFARRRPWMLAGVGMVAGIAAARFMKASSERRYDSYRQTTAEPQTRPDVSYGQRQLPPATAGFGAGSEVRGSAVPGEFGDDPLARDPYAGTAR